jgi:hypothetical protein
MTEEFSLPRSQKFPRDSSVEGRNKRNARLPIVPHRHGPIEFQHTTMDPVEVIAWFASLVTAQLPSTYP